LAGVSHNPHETVVDKSLIGRLVARALVPTAEDGVAVNIGEEAVLDEDIGEVAKFVADHQGGGESAAAVEVVVANDAVLSKS
jgi:hypothetical protein